MYLVLNTIANTYLPCGELLRDPKFLSSGNILSRFALQWLSLLGYRLKYYFGWKISEGAIILSGIGEKVDKTPPRLLFLLFLPTLFPSGGMFYISLGYNGFDKVSGTHKWDRVDAMDVFGFEFAQSLRGAQSAWNQTTNRWLRKYAYDRYARTRTPNQDNSISIICASLSDLLAVARCFFSDGSSIFLDGHSLSPVSVESYSVPAPFNLYYAYLVSAIWHGFYPGYYLFFMTAAFCTAVHRKVHTPSFRSKMITQLSLFSRR